LAFVDFTKDEKSTNNFLEENGEEEGKDF